MVVVTDLDRAWANVYVDEPVVPRLKLGQDHHAGHRRPAAGRRQDHLHLTEGRVHARNVQTAEERTKLVFRIKVTTDNRDRAS